MAVGVADAGEAGADEAGARTVRLASYPTPSAMRRNVHAPTSCGPENGTLPVTTSLRCVQLPRELKRRDCGPRTQNVMLEATRGTQNRA